LVLMLGLASLGAECSDGGSSGSSGSNFSSFNVNVDEGGELPPSDLPGPSVPEPSAALVFGVGLLVAGVAARRNR
jgi:hypothetical protein